MKLFSTAVIANKKMMRFILQYKKHTLLEDYIYFLN